MSDQPCAFESLFAAAPSAIASVTAAPPWKKVYEINLQSAGPFIRFARFLLFFAVVTVTCLFHSLARLLLYLIPSSV